MQTLGKTGLEKWMCSLYLAVLFLIVSAPVTYKLTDKLFGKLCFGKLCVLCTSNGCPTTCGLLIHALVFLLLVRLSMAMKPTEGMKDNVN